jgi:hypothetical protein
MQIFSLFCVFVIKTYFLDNFKHLNSMGHLMQKQELLQTGFMTAIKN